MRELTRACGAAGTPLLVSVRLEDGRQKNPRDRSSEIEPWMVRSWIRSDPAVRLIVTHADREFIEQVHFGATPAEASRILWDICWIWGPPEDHLALLLKTVGVERFVFGTGMPLRIPENSLAKLDLLDLSPEDRSKIEGLNL
jgi:predicted TIM-barrel fold metal-dependent hydrolase